ncbi:helix-turn-helix domain-containing protein [Erythrobacter insulae]|uniref:Helix-turn-helix domain-containing protein n=1 Tax=Erythrobacter insulae TaxID=2584124 RepID=A0A547PAZ5_9SPHN|nr:helix-turn-helix domain-containing protein [Erythrobacter insulae]TRD11319.1 helix-turn-helix domain-containing protein [Erythrobacter insulae]
MPSPFHLEYYNPPADLAEHVLALFHFAWDEREVEDRHPGALSQLVLFPYGSGELNISGRVDPLVGEGHLLAGFDVAAPFKMTGPWHAIGASLSPLGWAALTQSAANENFNRFMPATELLGPEIDDFAKATNDLYRSGQITGEEGCRLLADWIAPRLQPIPAAHKKLIEQGVAWLGTSLNPDVETLFGNLNYSRRQGERLVTRYFGLSPRALARKYRAVRAASLLAQPELTDEAEAEIADAFYDQPHMIREIRRYCGYTPTRLGGPQEPLFQTMLRLKNLDRLKQFRSIGSAPNPQD